MKFDIYVLREGNITCIGEDQNYLLLSGTFLKGFKLILSIRGDNGGLNEKRTSKNTNPFYIVDNSLEISNISLTPRDIIDTHHIMTLIMNE